MHELLPWVLASVSVTLLAAAGVMWWIRSRPQAPPPLPKEWALTARPIFTTEERRVYRQLREAVPHHIVVSKLPLVRFCQPNDPQDTRYWYQLLGSIHVTFAICSATGRVLAAVDLDAERTNSRRVLQIKQSVLGACRVRYLRCPADHLPSIPELQLLVPQSSGATRGPQPAPTSASSVEAAAAAAASKRREKLALWQDSSFFHDSFFSPDSRTDTGPPSDFGGLRSSGREGLSSTLPEDTTPGALDSTLTPPPPPMRH
jgi:Protein of unknown function (DUF2726)